MIIYKKISNTSFKIISLFILAFIIKGWNIAETDIGGDECFSVYNAQLSIPEIITWLSKGNNPPLWEILLHFWIKVFGIGEISIRGLSLIFNAATVIPLFLIGEQFIKKNVGFYAALLFVFSSFSLFLAHEARVYSLVGFLVCWSVYFYLSFLKNNTSKKFLIALTLVNGLILYSHYLAIWIIIVQVVLFISINSIRKQLGFKYLFHLVALILLFSPFILVIYKRVIDSGSNGTWVRKSNGIESLYFMLVDFLNAPVVAVLVLFLLLVSLVLRLLKKEFCQTSIILNATIWIPLIVSFLLSFKTGFFLNRYFYFVLPLLYLSIYSVIFSLNIKNKVLSYFIIISPIIAFVLSFEFSTKNMIHSGNHQEIKPIVEKIKSINGSNNSLIYLSPVWFDKEIVYYLDKQLFTSYFEEYKSEIVFKAPLNRMNIFPIYNVGEIQNELIKEEIVFIDNNSDFHLPNNGIFNYLLDLYTLKSKEQFAGIIVYTFVVRN